MNYHELPLDKITEEHSESQYYSKSNHTSAEKRIYHPPPSQMFSPIQPVDISEDSDEQRHDYPQSAEKPLPMSPTPEKPIHRFEPSATPDIQILMPSLKGTDEKENANPNSKPE